MVLLSRWVILLHLIITLIMALADIFYSINTLCYGLLQACYGVFGFLRRRGWWFSKVGCPHMEVCYHKRSGSVTLEFKHVNFCFLLPKSSMRFQFLRELVFTANQLAVYLWRQIPARFISNLSLQTLKVNFSLKEIKWVLMSGNSLLLINSQLAIWEK